MPVPAPEEIVLQARRIASSSAFAGSDPMRHLLEYLARHASKAPGEPVKEFTLATQALGKGPDYDPRSDSTVRVVASRLRSKLAEYYAQEGAHDPILLSLPKGSYVLNGTYREVEERPKPARPWVPFAAVAVVAAGLGFLPGFLTGRHAAPPAVAESTRLFWKHFVSGEPPIIVFSNPRFTGRPSTGMKLFTPSAPGNEPANSLYTGVGEVTAVRDISRQLAALGMDARVKRAQLFTWDDAHSSDLVFVGGQEQNLPMAQLPPLEKFNLKPDSEQPYLLRGAVRNEKPAAGEQPYYFVSPDLENGLEYAIVALTPGVTPNRRVLVLAGVHTFGTEAAAGFVSNPAMLADLLQRLGARGGEVPYFEALLELRVRGGTPLPPKLVLVYRRA